MTIPAAPTTHRARRFKRLAWWSLALFPVCFVGAFLVGEGLASLLGYDSAEGATAPLRVVLVAGLPALVVFALPAVLTVYFGRRAMHLGQREALAPVVIALTVAGGFVVLNLLSYVAGLVFGP